MWYDLKGVLSSSSFVINYAGADGNLDQEVVIKEFFPSEIVARAQDGSVQPRSPDKQAQLQHGFQQFLNEARILAKLKHMSIVEVLSLFEANNTGYVVMGFLSGSTLGEHMETHAANEQVLKQLLSTLLDALELIHTAGFYHLAIQPANIILHDDGTPVLSGFGAARQSYARRARALRKVLLPGYAAVEQYAKQSSKQGPSTDIYALAAVLYEAIVGHTPAAALDRMTALEGGNDPYKPLSQLGDNRYAPKFLEAIDWALAYHRTQRPQTVAEWRAALQVEKLQSQPAAPPKTAVHSEFREEPAADVPPEPAAPQPDEPVRQRSRLAWILGILLVIVLATGLGPFLVHRTLNAPAVREVPQPADMLPTDQSSEPAVPATPVDEPSTEPDQAVLRRLQLAEVALEIAEQAADFELAVQELKQVLVLDEQLPRAHLLLSQAYQRLGKATDAERHLTRYRELSAE